MLKTNIRKQIVFYGVKSIILSLLLSLYSCSKNNNKDKSHLVFRYNEHKNISSLDPAFAKDLSDIWATNQLFNGLLQTNDSLNIIPSIAKSWVITDSAKTYTFKIRSDVYFHKHHLFGNDSTRSVIANDFVYSFNRLLDNSLASPGRWILSKVNTFYAENDSIFVIKLKQPFPGFLGLLSMKYCSVVPHEVVEHYGAEFRSNPIGTGPFLFKRWEENTKLVLRKNKHYFETDTSGVTLPYLEAVAITFLPDKQSEFLQFVQGNIDFVSGLDASYKDDILTANGQLKSSYESSVNMIRGPYLNTEYLAFLMDSDINEVQSEDIRQAISMAFDRKKMITYLRNGIGIAANGGFIPKGLPGYSQNIGYTYNPEFAKSLVNNFKNKTGITNPKITLTTTSNYLSYCEYIQREVEKIGIKIDIDVIPASGLKDLKANAQLHFFRGSWIADYPDAENYLSLYYSKNFAPMGPNYTHYKNSLFDQWYQQSFSETSHKRRAILYRQMDSLVMQSAVVIPLFYDEVVRFTKKNVDGLGINPTNLLELKYVKKINTP